MGKKHASQYANFGWLQDMLFDGTIELIGFNTIQASLARTILG